MSVTRPSNMPIAMLCPSASMKPAYRIQRETEDTRLGNANHKLCAEMVTNGIQSTEESSASIIKMAERYEVDPLKLSELFRNAEEAWESLSAYFRNPVAEHEFIHGGTCDVMELDVDDEVACIILDWKKKRNPGVRYQIREYCAKARHHMTCLGTNLKGRTFKGIAVYCEDGAYDVWDFGEEDFLQREEDLSRIQREAGKVYNPGDHCSWCPRAHECFQREDYARQGASVLQILDEAGLELGPKAAELYHQASHVEKMLKQFKDWLRAEIKRTGEPLDLGDGRELAMSTVRRKSVDPEAAWGVLKHGQGLSNEEMRAVIDIRIGEAVKIVRSKVNKKRDGITKKDAEATFIERLRSADALEYSTTEMLRPRKKKVPEPARIEAVERLEDDTKAS